MKKILFWIFLGVFALVGVTCLPSFVNAEDPEDGGTEQGSTTSDPAVGAADGFNKGGWNGQKDNDEVYSAKVAGSGELRQDSLINVIKTAINWVLGMLSLVALALALYAGFLMMTSGGDEKKYEKGVGLLKWAGIGLAIIALSWLIVSLVFWLINGSIGGASE